MESEVNTWSKYVSKQANVRNAHYAVKCMNRIGQKAKLPSNGRQGNYNSPKKAKDQRLIPDTQQSGLMNQIAFLSAGVLQFLVDITYSVHVPKDGG